MSSKSTSVSEGEKIPNDDPNFSNLVIIWAYAIRAKILGTGILLSEDVVLTAQHVVTTSGITDIYVGRKCEDFNAALPKVNSACFSDKNSLILVSDLSGSVNKFPRYNAELFCLLKLERKITPILPVKPTEFDDRNTNDLWLAGASESYCLNKTTAEYLSSGMESGLPYVKLKPTSNGGKARIVDGDSGGPLLQINNGTVSFLGVITSIEDAGTVGNISILSSSDITLIENKINNWEK
jgi:Trypsin